MQKTFVKGILISLIICQIKSLDAGMVLTKNLTGSSPGGVFEIGILNSIQTLQVTSILPSRYVYIYLMTKTRILRAKDIAPLAIQSLSIGPSTQTLYLFIHGFIPQFSVIVKLDNVQLTSLDPYSQGWYNPRLKELAIHKFIYVKNDCIIQVDKNSFSNPYKISNTWLNFQDFSASKTITIGIYLIEIYKKDFDLNDIATPFSLPIYSKQGNQCQIEEVYFCKDGYWAYPTFPDICRYVIGDKCSLDGQSTVILGCKNNILDFGQACDNTLTGCGSDCQPQHGYECFANNTCSLKCGNGAVDIEEQCDNVTGCTSYCQADSGYECSGNVCTPICTTCEKTEDFSMDKIYGQLNILIPVFFVILGLLFILLAYFIVKQLIKCNKKIETEETTNFETSGKKLKVNNFFSNQLIQGKSSQF